MAVALIADAHLGGSGGSPQPLVRQLDRLLPETCERLVLLGDLFHVWIGIQKYETPDLQTVTSALERVRSRGIPVDYVEGNRDFFLRGGPYERLFDRLGTEVTFSVGSRRYLAVHGDGLNDRDYAYRLWRFLSKNRLSQLAYKVLPSILERPLIHGAERRLSQTNFKHKRELPEKAIKQYAGCRFVEGYDGLVLGHFHEPRCWQLESGEVFLLDAWFNSKSIEWLPRDTEVPVAAECVAEIAPPVG